MHACRIVGVIHWNQYVSCPRHKSTSLTSTIIHLSTTWLTSTFAFVAMETSHGWQDSCHTYRSSIHQCTRLFGGNPIPVSRSSFVRPVVLSTSKVSLHRYIRHLHEQGAAWLIAKIVSWAIQHLSLLSSLSSLPYMTCWESSHSLIMAGA